MRDGASWSAAGEGRGWAAGGGGRVTGAGGYVKGVARSDDAKALYLGLRCCGAEIGSGGRWPRCLSFSYAVLGSPSGSGQWLSAPSLWLSAREESYL